MKTILLTLVYFVGFGFTYLWGRHDGMWYTIKRIDSEIDKQLKNKGIKR
jgi:hypothetical protein